MEEEKIILGPGDVCTLLQIKESTLRKYALILQAAGYHFDTNSKGQRAYYDKDVIAIRKLIEIKSGSDMTLEQSANAVMTWFEQSNMSLRATPKKEEPTVSKSDIEDLKEIINQQNVLLIEVVKRLDQQQKYIDEKLEQRDQRLMESIRESQEVKQQLLQLATAQEEEKQKKPKKGWFNWFSKD